MNRKNKIILIIIIVISFTVGVACVGRYAYVRYRYHHSQNQLLNTFETKNTKTRKQDENSYEAKYHVQPIGALEIPAIGVKNGIIKGTTLEDMFWGIGWYTGSPLPNMTETNTGNLYLCAHDQGYAPIFHKLSDLVNGNLIYLFYDGNTYVYEVYNKVEINPDNASYMQNQPDKSIISLQTCNPSGTMRWIVQGKLVARVNGTKLLSTSNIRPIRDFNNGEDGAYLKALREGKVNAEGQII